MQTILIVDDTPELLDCLQQLLVRYSYKVIPARDAEVALAVINGGASVDLVITDYHMPGMHGLELVDRLKRTAPAVPVIMCSAFAGQDLCRDALAIGVAAFVQKPYSVQALKQVVNDVLEQARTKQAPNV